jgi:hypothetical protein
VKGAFNGWPAVLLAKEYGRDDVNREATDGYGTQKPESLGLVAFGRVRAWG